MSPLAELMFLRSPAGVELLREASELVGSLPQRVERLRRSHSAEQVSAALKQIELRERAATKFQHPERMLFTAQGVEQASALEVAAWRAKRFPQGAAVLDLCCGNGGDALALAARGPVFAFDIDPAAAFCAMTNSGAAGVSDSMQVAAADVTRLNLKGDAAFFDPSRRRGDRRIRGADEWQPPLSFAREVSKAAPNLCVKVSPAIDDSDIEELGARAEFVSLRGECREAALWFGGTGPRAGRSAAVLPAGVVLEQREDARAPDVTEPRAWLYEPDPAVVRAHLIWECAELLDASQVDSQIAYLTGDSRVESPFARGYRILEWMPFSLKRVDRRLRELGRRVYAIKRRGVPLEPEALSRDLKGGGDQQAVVVLTRVNGEPAAILCERADG
jgi:SAM-dependent methyltransferase